MINILIIIMLGIAIAGGAAFAVVSFLTASQSAGDAYLNIIRLEEAAAAIQSSTLFISGAVRAPAGDNPSGSDYTQVPTWVTHNARTMSGIPFLYCPYSTNAVAGTTANVEYPGSGNYAIQTISSADTGNHAYVMTSGAAPSAAPAGTIALLIMPAPTTTTVPSCADVTTSNGSLIVSGGVVIPVVANQPLATRYVPAAPSAINIYIAPAASGTGSGRDAVNAMTLDDAMQLWRDLQPHVTVMNLASGTYNVTIATFSATGLDATNKQRTRLVWRGAPGAMTSTIVTTANTYDTMYLPVDWYWENLTFNNNFTNNAAGLDIKNLASLGLSNVTLNTSAKTITVGGVLNIYDATTITVTGFIADPNSAGRGRVNIMGPLTVNGYGILVSDLRIASSLTLNGFISGPNTKIADSVVNINSGQTNSASAFAVMKNSTVNFSRVYGVNNALRLQGTSAYIDNSNLTFSGFTYGIDLYGGGSLFLTNGSQLGSASLKAGTAIRTNIAGYFGGQIGGDSTYLGARSTIYAGSACWNNGTGTHVFADSAEGNGQSSAARNNTSPTDYRYLVTQNRSDWLCER